MNNRQDCKVFIGGLSWETSDQKLRAYFENYGAVQEAFVSYDRNTGRPRGFGFVVFENGDVADKVVASKHTIDRREVEAKKAVPKDENHTLRQNQGSQNSKTKKIFVGGLPPTVDEKALRGYFEKFGPLEDAVVMYDHENKRPRGFGFITFAEEDSVEKVFNHGPMQTIGDKQIEIKPAVPRDQMPPIRRQLPYPTGKAFPHRPAPYPFQQQAPTTAPFRPFPNSHPSNPVHHHMMPGMPQESLPLQQAPRTAAATTSTSFSSMPTYQSNGSSSLSGLAAVGQNIPNLSTTYGMTNMNGYSSMPAAGSSFAGQPASNYSNFMDVNGLSQQLQGLGSLGKLGRIPEAASVKAFAGLPSGLQFEHFTSQAMDTPAFSQHESSSLTSGDPEVQAFDINSSRPANASSAPASTPFSAFSDSTFSTAPAPGWST